MDYYKYDTSRSLAPVILWQYDNAENLKKLIWRTLDKIAEDGSYTSVQTGVLQKILNSIRLQFDDFYTYIFNALQEAENYPETYETDTFATDEESERVAKLYFGLTLWSRLAGVERPSIDDSSYTGGRRPVYLLAWARYIKATIYNCFSNGTCDRINRFLKILLPHYNAYVIDYGLDGTHEDYMTEDFRYRPNFAYKGRVEYNKGSYYVDYEIDTEISATGRPKNRFISAVLYNASGSSVGAITFDNKWSQSKISILSVGRQYKIGEFAIGFDTSPSSSRCRVMCCKRACKIIDNYNVNLETTGDWVKVSKSTSPAWSGTTTYSVGSVVVHNQKYFVSKVNSNINHTPNGDDGYWSKCPITPFAYDSSYTYNTGDWIVSNYGILYLCIHDGTSAETWDGSKWEPVNPMPSEYDATKSSGYEVGDFVQQAGQIYGCVTKQTAQTFGWTCASNGIYKLTVNGTTYSPTKYIDGLGNSEVDSSGNPVNYLKGAPDIEKMMRLNYGDEYQLLKVDGILPRPAGVLLKGESDLGGEIRLGSLDAYLGLNTSKTAASANASNQNAAVLDHGLIYDGS